MKKIDEYKLAKSFLQDKKWQKKWDEIFKEVLSEPCSSLNPKYTLNNHAKDIISALLFAQALDLAQRVIKMQQAGQEIQSISKRLDVILGEIHL
jgi:hypothetical protein